MSSSCDDLAQQIATLNTLVGRLNNLSEAKVRQIVNEIVNPQINEVTIHLEAASTDARTANKTANTALQKVNSFQPGNYATIADLRLQRNAIDTEIQQFRQNIANGLATKAEKSAVEAYDAAMRADIQRVENAAARAESSARNSKSSASSALEDAVASAKAKEIAELKAKVAGDSAASSKNYAEVSAGAKETSVKASLTAEEQAAIALRNANNALNNANSSEASANAAKAYRDTVAKDASLVEGLIDKTRTFVGDAANSASKSAKSALDANAAVDGAKGLVKGFSERMDGFGRALNALEGKIGAAIQTAANAVGISNEALAATGRLAGKIAGIFVLISQIFVIIEQTANLNILGERIDAVERGLEFLGNSVSGILGKLLGLQNRIARNEATIVDVKAIAVDARLIGEGAARIAGDAQIHADR
ncbi:hypothetical protein, partial [Nostoc sp. 'Peltigera membranacea cyanobiont' 232]|uniref:hypothetical protein n=1 Tax=Nostoc sp. 'Peltigera membranacea cyanobiont' 232 TaxID=2014531 RepID=UPI000B9F42AC